MKSRLITIILFISVTISAQTATEYFTLAKEQVSKRKYYKAIPNYKKAIEKDSTNLEYHWLLAEAILKENIRGAHRTDDGVFEGLQVLNKMIVKGASSVKIYERIASTNQYILNDYYNRYKNFKSPKTESWQDDKPDTSEKKRFKNITLKAYNAIVNGNNKILELDSGNANAKSNLKYLKKPVFDEK